MPTSHKPKITFGIIILNGEPFTPYNLRSIYPFAHEIIIVEGAYWASKAVATPDGHSLDNTLEALYRFKKEEDPRGIVKIITKDGFWDGLTEQCQAWVKEATGDYIWAIDIDEFYRPEDMERVIDMLANKPSITMVSFKLIQFCFDFDYVIYSGRDYFKHGIMECRRIFKIGPGYTYVQHEPPTVINEQGIDLKNIEYVDDKKTAQLGMYIYHYTAIFKTQLENKAKAYSLRGWKNKSEYAMNFVKNWVNLDNPFHLGWEYKYYTWIEKFKGTHPPEIMKLKEDLSSGKVVIEQRENTDIEMLIATTQYRRKKNMYKLYEKVRVLLTEAKNEIRTTYFRNRALLAKRVKRVLNI